MGCFNSKKEISQVSVSDSLFKYNRKVSVKIKVRDSNGKTTGYEHINFNVTEPLIVKSEEIPLGTEKVLASACILPGTDPRGEYKKTCQDNCVYIHNNNGILCCLFDGHGKEGEKVADFCTKKILALFYEENSLIEVKFIQKDPKEFIRTSTERCHTDIVNNLSIDSNYSGW